MAFNPNTAYALVIAILTGGFALEATSLILNLKALQTDLPVEFKNAYDPVRYSKSIEYQRVNHRFALIRDALIFAVVLAFFATGGFGAIDRAARQFGLANRLGEITVGVLFAGALAVLRGMLALPFGIYHTFVIEERFGFNRTSAGTYAADLLKGFLLGAVIGGPVFAGILVFFRDLGPHAWLYAWAGLSAIQLIILYLAPAVILPWFNKFEPLAEGPVKTAIDEMTRTLKFRLGGIFVMDGSKRSTKSNAFFTGFGRFRKLVLFDTLLSSLSTEEVVSVFAHEVGHFRLGHIPRFVATALLSSGLTFFLLSLALGNEALAAAFGLPAPAVYSTLICASILYAPIARIGSVLGHRLSRKAEFEADRYSADTYGRPESMATALIKLSSTSYSHLTPHPLKVLLDYTHPPVLQRIRALADIRPVRANELLRETKAMLCTVESCTGGLIGHMITQVAGSSEVFWGGAVTYDNSAKQTLAAVPADVIPRFGAVSEEAARAMAEGGLKLLTAARPELRHAYCLATTGIAGPGGGSAAKPVGLCYIALASLDGPIETRKIQLESSLNRARLKESFAQNAIVLLIEVLERSRHSA